jgi:hypothetical protein
VSNTITPPSYELTEANVLRQVADINARFNRLLGNMTPAQLNWQPDNGRRWSIGQCLDHITKAGDVYMEAIREAVGQAPGLQPESVYPNPLGRAFIWFIEPPPRFRTSAPKTAVPASSFDPQSVGAEFERGLAAVQALAANAMKSGAGRAKFANPFAGGRRVFNVATGIMVLLAHARRHLLQAEKVKALPDFPSA